MFRQNAFLYVLITFVMCRKSANGMENMRLKIESTSFEPCPHVKNGQLLTNKTRIDIQQGAVNMQKYGVAQLSRLQVVDERGETKNLQLPGCFNIRVDTTFTQSIDNPYVEAFVKSDRQELCQKFKVNPYCSTTDNLSARILTQNQVTCRFCDLCVTAEEAVAQARKENSEGLTIRADGNACSDNGGKRIEANRLYPLELNGICTPSAAEIERQLDEKFGAGWRNVDFIRRGSIIMTIHIMDRRHPAPKPCLQLGSGTYKWRGPAVLEGRVRENLRNTCTKYQDPVQEADRPNDDYLGCYNGYVNYAIDRQ